MNTSALILAFDIGTSSLRTALFDAQGRRLESTLAQETYRLRVGHDGTAELAIGDLEKAALRAVRKTLRVKARTRPLRGRPIAAVGTSCFWHSLLGYNARTQEPTPIYTWADARCGEDALRLRERRREASYHARTGCMLRTPYWPAKLRWLARTKQAAGVTAWMSPADWLYGRLCGADPVGISMASGTGLMNMRTGAWDASLLRLAGVTEKALGKISDEPVHVERRHPILPPLHRFPELREALWFPALGDGAASNLGSDAVKAHTAALNVGTSAALRLVRGEIPQGLDSGLFCYRVDGARWLLGGAISNAGNLRAWALEQLRVPDDPAAVEKVLAGRTRPDGSLTVLPFWTGERSPSWPESVGGTVTGLTYATTAVDILQALVEATYHRLAQIADLLQEQTGPRLEVIVSGGIRKSPESLQRLANVLGRSIRICVEPEASLRGAAVHALARLGGRIPLLARGESYRPDRAAGRVYGEIRAAQIALEEKMADFRPAGRRTARKHPARPPVADKGVLPAGHRRGNLPG